MKRKIIALVLLVCLLLPGCSSDTHGETAYEKSDIETSMFVTVEKYNMWEVVYHKDTKVMYAVSDGSYNHGNFTLLVNADGSPMLWEE